MRRWFHFSKSASKSTRTRAIDTRANLVRAIFLTLVASVAAGCDSSFVPPPPPELSEASGTASATLTETARPASADIGPASANSIDVVLSSHQGDESEAWKAAVRSQAGMEKVRVKILGPAEAPATQADLVREAMARRPRVILIESTSASDPALNRSIEDARSQGIPVVIVGQRPGGEMAKSSSPDPAHPDKSASPGKTPVVVVAPKPFGVSATQLVATVLRACRAADVESGKSAILLFNTAGDLFITERTLALKDALKAAGITVVDELRLSENTANSRKALGASLKANAQTFLIFSVDSMTSAVIKDFIKDDADHRFLVAGCYAGEDSTGEMSKIIKIAAIASFTPSRLLRKGVSTAALLAQGQDVPAEVEFPINIAESLATPAMLKGQALQWKPSADAPPKAKK